MRNGNFSSKVNLIKRTFVYLAKIKIIQVSIIIHGVYQNIYRGTTVLASYGIFDIKSTYSKDNQENNPRITNFIHSSESAGS